jgi:hypothetical protein
MMIVDAASAGFPWGAGFFSQTWNFPDHILDAGACDALGLINPPEHNEFDHLEQSIAMGGSNLHGVCHSRGAAVCSGAQNRVS